MGTNFISLGEVAEGASKLTDVFGRWPSFHDAEVLRLRMDRAAERGPSLQADIHVFEMTSEVDERGYYVLRHHTEATLEFCDIRLATCKWFNIQNVIDDPLCEPLDADAEDGYVYRITIPSLHGVEIELDCKSIRVLSAKPFVK